MNSPPFFRNVSHLIFRQTKEDHITNKSIPVDERINAIGRWMKRVERWVHGNTNKYVPHQGKKECEKRRKAMLPKYSVSFTP